MSIIVYIRKLSNIVIILNIDIRSIIHMLDNRKHPSFRKLEN